MKLIIVESPTKAKTIGKFLGSAYRVESSFGHVRDLPQKKLGVDVENDFHPTYEVPAKAQKTITNLKKISSKSDEVILASDEDREGEAIAWHLSEVLGLDNKKAKRIVFHEITKDAIAEALKNPRTINLSLVDAQQARRILDRLVGYELSPFLWKKVAKGLSAGRVQSVAVRLIVEREREIKDFKAQEYWTIKAVFETDKENALITADLGKISGKTLDKFFIKDEAQAKDLVTKIKSEDYQVSAIERKTAKKNPPTPFTTSTLQQGSNRWLGFSAKQTMMVAQKLYELGYITYMRTDSLNLSSKFIEESRSYLTNNLGKEYCLPDARVFKNKSRNAQEAHEAVRPTEASRTPESLEGKLEPEQLRLYRLIWQRSLATQMPAAELDTTAIVISSGGQEKYEFRAAGQILKFDGYLRVYPEKTKDQELPDVAKGQELAVKEISPLQHFTEPPARYSDAGLVKEMEKHGIGRPSTYAPTISTIIDRNYVQRDDNKRLAPTDIAFVVIDLLIKHFNQIVDYKFTAGMENNLDNIANGSENWIPVIKDFYSPFHSNLENKYKEVEKKEIVPEEASEEICDKCGAPMIIKTGRFGKFYACSAYPACKNIKSFNKSPKAAGAPDNEKMTALKEKYKGEICDKCGADMAVKIGKYGPFLACSAYPKCKNIKNVDDGTPEIICPVCGEGKIVKKFSRRGPFYACSAYPNCKNSYSGKPTGAKCPQCGALMIEGLDGQGRCSAKGCGYSAS